MGSMVYYKDSKYKIDYKLCATICQYLDLFKPFLSHVSQVSSQFSQNLSILLLLSLVDFGLLNLSNLEGFVKLILVEFGLGKFNLFDCSLVKSDVTKKKKKKPYDMLSCCN